MEWWGRRIREGRNARTYVLAGVLAVVLWWAFASGEKTDRPRPNAVADRAAAGAPSPAPSPRAAEATATPPGWGEDPFQRW